MNLAKLLPCLLVHNLLFAEVNESNIPDSLLSKMATVRKKLVPIEREVMKAIRGGKREHAATLCRKMIEVAPFAPGGYYNLACMHALDGKKEDALKMLEQAIERGLNNVLHLQTDPDLHSLHDELRFATLVQRAEKHEPAAGYKATPFHVKSQTAWVEDSNVEIHPELKMLFARYRFETAPPPGRAITALGGKAGELLKMWEQENTASGNWGDIYDNRDGDHSNISRALFPQLTWIEYSQNAKDAKLNWGIATTVIQQGVVIGNASVAQTSGPFWRSMPRMAHANQKSVDFLYWQYTHNKIYVYPGHVDYPRNPKELEQKKRHDVFPTNSPYVIATQGSSGSDRVFLRALAATLAAFSPEVKKSLIEKGMIAPALQYILRRSSKQVKSEEDYFTGPAHPTVFTGSQMDIEKMVTMAHEMNTNAMPPLIRLRVVEEDEFTNGRDYFAAPGRTEKLFDSPCAISRAFRGHQKWRRMIVSAEDSTDANEKPLTYRWSVLRGDNKLIKIRPLNKTESRVELRVSWHPRRPIAPASTIESNRVDIGAFAYNGVHHSAPAFVTFYSLDHEARVYDEKDRIRSITYTGAKEKGKYTDPVVALPKSWRDEYKYGDDGQMIGWTRHHGKKEQQFDSDGKLSVRIGQGPKAEAKEVKYKVRHRKNQSPVLFQAGME